MGGPIAGAAEINGPKHRLVVGDRGGAGEGELACGGIVGSGDAGQQAGWRNAENVAFGVVGGDGNPAGRCGSVVHIGEGEVRSDGGDGSAKPAGGCDPGRAIEQGAAGSPSHCVTCHCARCLIQIEITHQPGGICRNRDTSISRNFRSRPHCAPYANLIQTTLIILAPIIESRS